MKNFTKVSLFSDSTNSEEQKIYESMTRFVSKELYLKLMTNWGFFHLTQEGGIADLFE